MQPPDNPRNLWHALASLWPSYLAYVMTFMLIGQIWANHHVMFDHIRHVDRAGLLLNTLLLMDIAFLPFAASVLANALRDGHDQRTAVVFHGLAFTLAALLFNALWAHARHRRRLLANTITPEGAATIARRFQLALAWLATGTILGAIVPALGLALIGAFVIYYWFPIPGEIGRAA